MAVLAQHPESTSGRAPDPVHTTTVVAVVPKQGEQAEVAVTNLGTAVATYNCQGRPTAEMNELLLYRHQSSSHKFDRHGNDRLVQPCKFQCRMRNADVVVAAVVDVEVVLAWGVDVKHVRRVSERQDLQSHHDQGRQELLRSLDDYEKEFSYGKQG